MLFECGGGKMDVPPVLVVFVCLRGLVTGKSDCIGGVLMSLRKMTIMRIRCFSVPVSLLPSPQSEGNFPLLKVGKVKEGGWWWWCVTNSTNKQLLAEEDKKITLWSLIHGVGVGLLSRKTESVLNDEKTTTTHNAPCDVKDLTFHFSDVLFSYSQLNGEALLLLRSGSIITTLWKHLLLWVMMRLTSLWRLAPAVLQAVVIVVRTS